MAAGPAQRAARWEGGEIAYELERKRVKNLNLRVRRDGSVYVSANPRVSLGAIDAFVAGNGALIRRAQERFARQEARAQALEPVPREACLPLFTQAVERQLPLVAPYGVTMPQVKVREMKSRWGSCAWKKGAITLNARLYHAPRECLDYVVLHELCHFIYPNHGPAFHALMARIMPDYKARKRTLEAQCG